MSLEGARREDWLITHFFQTPSAATVKRSEFPHPNFLESNCTSETHVRLLRFYGSVRNGVRAPPVCGKFKRPKSSQRGLYVAIACDG